MSNNDDRHLAMLFASKSWPSVTERFLSSLPKDMRAYCDETIRMHGEFTSNVERMLIAPNYSEAIAHAEFISRHAKDVAYRWAQFRAALTQYTLRDFRPMSCGYEKGDE